MILNQRSNLFLPHALVSIALLLVMSSANAYLVPGPDSGGGDTQDGVVGSIGTAPDLNNDPYAVPPDASPYDPVQVPAPIYGGNHGYPTYPTYPTYPSYPDPQYGGNLGGHGGGWQGDGHHDQQQGLKARRLVRLLYLGALMRKADPQGLEYYMNYIRSSGYAGLVQAAREIGASPEMQNLVWQQGPRRVINNIYRVFFGRNPDPAAEAWVQMLQQGRGGEVLAGIVSSQEFSIKQMN